MIPACIFLLFIITSFIRTVSFSYDIWALTEMLKRTSITVTQTFAVRFISEKLSIQKNSIQAKYSISLRDRLRYSAQKGNFKLGISEWSLLFFPKALNIGMYGRSSDLSRFFEAFPSRVLGTVAGSSINHHPAQRRIGHHSSGYCCGFWPHSLFITVILFHCNTKTLQIYMIYYLKPNWFSNDITSC